MKERLNYIITENKFVGTLVNMPIVGQADTLEGLRVKMKIMAKMWIEQMQ